MVVLVDKKYITPQDNILCLLPLCFLLGFVCAESANEQYPVEQAFDYRAEAVLHGTVASIETTGTKPVACIQEVSIELSGELYACGQVRLYYDEGDLLLPGNQITCIGTIYKFDQASNLGQFDEDMYYKIKGYDYKFKSKQIWVNERYEAKRTTILERIKQRMLQSYATMLSEDEYGLVAAMLLGESSYLDKDIKTLYQKNGISHLLAISGLHISLLGMGIHQLLRTCNLGIYTSNIITILFLLCYGSLTGFGVSTMRAVIMMTLSLCARLIGKTYDSICAMTISAWIILMNNPLQLFSVGFLLSYGAIIAIVLVYPTVVKGMEVMHPLAKTLLTSVCIQTITLPIVLSIFYEYPLYSIAINACILPLSSLLVGLAFLGGVIGCCSMVVGSMFLGGAHYILSFMELLCRIFIRMPGCTQVWGKPSMVKLIVYYIGVILLICIIRYITWSQSQRESNKLPDNEKISTPYVHVNQILFACMLSLTLILLPNKTKGIEVTILDVGQGDGIYMESSTGNNYLIDAGSSQRTQLAKERLIPFLSAKGGTKIDTVFITHSDADHTSAIISLLEQGYHIGKVILPNVSMGEEAYIELVDIVKQANVPLYFMGQGDELRDGALTITCLHPYDRFVPQTVNAYSLVLRVTYGNFSMLLTGDLEGGGEEALYEYLLQQEELAPYDVLKVAHHGSKHSTPSALLALLNPRWSVISAGANNSYGHPNKELLDRLEDAKTSIHSTIEDGAICIKSNGRRITLEGYKSKRKTSGRCGS